MNKIMRTITILLIFGLTACVSSQSNVVASNDEDKDIGLGGTGMLASTGSDSGSGLGGTGIIGEITGFGSIFVNGIEIEYDDKTAFTINGETSAHQQLEIGDVVEVLTVDDKQHTQAQIINLRHEIIGVVESVDPQTYSFTVNGQSIVQSIVKSTFPEVGTTVAVAGFRIDGQTIVSTRVTPAKTGQDLLRSDISLPFIKDAQRWLIQTHTKSGKVIFQNDDVTRSFSLDNKADKSVKNSLGIKILQLQKSATGKINLTQIVEAVNIPRGKRLLNPVRQQGSDISPNITTEPVLTPHSGAAGATAPGSGTSAVPNQPIMIQNKQTQTKQNGR
jgi:hypothetical protein